MEALQFFKQGQIKKCSKQMHKYKQKITGTVCIIPDALVGSADVNI